jgi:CheY-like chemotaxis protein
MRQTAPSAIVDSPLQRVRTFLRRHRAENPRSDDAAAIVQRAVRPTVPARVLLVAPDRKFAELAASLLNARGCGVTIHDGGDIAVQAVRKRIDVVLLDATGATTNAGRVAAALQARRPPIGLVAVSSDPRDLLCALPVLPKRGSIDGLYLAVERARREAWDV